MVIWLLLACHEPPPECAAGWDWDGSACVARLPEGDGVEGPGDPQPLLPGEFSDAELHALAERFQPAQVFAGPKIWPVSVSYCFEAGGDLLRYDDADTDLANPTVAIANADLAAADWATRTRDGVFYVIDCPGDNTSGAWDDATWFTEWDRIQGDDPATAPYPPVDYVHFAWFDRGDSLLMAQYWFYYPYDKFSNSHEGDWENATVVLDVTDEPEIVDVHFAFHQWATRELKYLTRITDDDGGDHPVVFTSGCADLDGWGGCYSGATWPWPGEMYTLTIEDTRPQARFLHPDDIGVILLPDDVAAGADADVGWMGLRVFFGQWEVLANHPVILLGGANHPPTPPPYKGNWGRPEEDTWDEGEYRSEFERFVPPEGWDVLYNPGHPGAVDPE